MSMSKKEAEVKADELSKDKRMFEIMEMYVQNGIITKEEANEKIKAMIESLAFSFSHIQSLIITYHDVMRKYNGKNDAEFQKYVAQNLAGMFYALEVSSMKWATENPGLSNIYLKGLYDYFKGLKEKSSKGNVNGSEAK